MALRTLCFCIGLSLLAKVAYAQNEAASSAPVTRAQFDELRALVEENAIMLGKLKESLQRSDQPGDANANLDTVTDVDIEELEVGLSGCCKVLAERVKRHLATLRDEQHDHGRRLGQIARKGQNDEYFPYFNANNDAARQHLRDVMKETAPRNGRIIINNRMETDQYILVNGRQYRILAGGFDVIDVPRGTVSTRLPGQEPVYWTLSAPDYEQSIDIRPRSALRTNGWVGGGSYYYFEPVSANSPPLVGTYAIYR